VSEAKPDRGKGSAGGVAPAPPLRPAAGAPGPAAPPLAVPAPSNREPAARLLEPRVISFTEEVHSCKAGDTFEGISEQKYGSRKYARALLLFNRSHPLAGDELMQDPNGLKPKQRVYVPPLDVLESRYPSAIQNLKPQAAPPPARP
jgi:nucleoid-associated protein YgaU